MSERHYDAARIVFWCLVIGGTIYLVALVANMIRLDT